jgi:PEP-CTERM motif
MTRRVPIVASMLTLGMALLVSPARADPILITGGSMVVEGPSGGTVGTVDIHGTQGFSAQLRLGLASTSGPWLCCPTAPGTSIDMRGVFAASDGFGLVELNGTSYGVPSLNADIFVRPFGEPVIAPPLSSSALLTAPFDLVSGSTSSAVVLFDVEGKPIVIFPLVGRGVATLELTPSRGAPAWEFVRVRYDFESPAVVPEPTTLLLVGTGVIALAARRRRRRSR